MNQAQYLSDVATTDRKMNVLRELIRKAEGQIEWSQKRIVELKIDLDFDPTDAILQCKMSINIKDLARAINRRDVLQAELDKLTAPFETQITPNMKLVPANTVDKQETYMFVVS